MVNFRYHLVTITAIFVALAVGITLGVTVANTASDQVQRQLEGVRAETRRIDATNRELESRLESWERFGDGAASGLLSGRLVDVPVLLIGVRGVDGQIAKDVRETLAHADANFLGTIWLTGKLELDRTEDADSLATILALPALAPSQVRASAISRLARQLAAPDRPRPAATTTVPATVPEPPTSTTAAVATAASTTSTTLAREVRPTLLAGLAAGGFVDLEDPAGGDLDPQSILPESTRFVVLSQKDVDVADDQAAIPLVAGIVDASSGQARTVAVEAGRPARDREPEVRAAFIVPLRQSSEEVDEAVSTVNNVEDFRGLATMVLALADLGLNRIGHYGVGAGADRLVPEAG